MFNFFKKNENLDKLDPIEAAFIRAIVNSLSIRYPLFQQEIDLEIFVGIGKNPGGTKGSFTYLINNDRWKKICDTSIDNFFIKNIKFNSYKGEKVIVDLFTSEGLIIGYKTNVHVKDVNVETIDVSGIWEKHFLNKEFSEIEGSIGSLSKDQQKRLNMVKNTFRIEVGGSAYYPVHDIEDGNYIAIDKTGAVYRLTHDPFKVEKVYETLIDFLNSSSE